MFNIEYSSYWLYKDIGNYCKCFLSIHVQYNLVDSEVSYLKIYFILFFNVEIILPKCFDEFKDDLGENQVERLIWVKKIH